MLHLLLKIILWDSRAGENGHFRGTPTPGGGQIRDIQVRFERELFILWVPPPKPPFLGLFGPKMGFLGGGAILVIFS